MKPGPFRAVALVGPRAAGKSTLLPVLAARLQFDAIDTDARLAGDAGLPAGTLLVRLGEAEFRRREAAVVLAALGASRTVAALGGGALGDDRIVQALQAADLLAVLLLARPEVLLARLRADPTPRPSLLGLPPEQEVPELLRRRLPRYRQAADLELDTGELSPAMCVDAILRRFEPPRP